jgi:hypothetical protein
MPNGSLPLFQVSAGIRGGVRIAAEAGACAVKIDLSRMRFKGQFYACLVSVFLILAGFCVGSA